MRTITVLVVMSLSLISCGQVEKENSHGYTIKGCDYKIFYFPNNKIREEGCLVNGKKEGIWKQYVKEGWQRFEWTYVNDKEDGQYKSFYEDGKINSIGFKKNGALSDTIKFYENNGELFQLEVWKPTGENESTLIYTECFGPGIKPDGAIQHIDGKKYLWMNGAKTEVR